MVVSSNPAFLPNSGLALVGYCNDLDLWITPPPGVTGFTTITLTVQDVLGSSTSTNFTFEVVANTNVSVPDTNLFTAIDAALQDPGPVLSLYAMRSLHTLVAEGFGITNATGLQAAINLTYLDLQFNDIADASPFSGLTNLQTLLLDDNPVGNLNFTTQLKALTFLSVEDAGIQDVSPITNKINLSDLDLSLNPLTNAASLSNLVNLQVLWLSDTGLRDLSFLSGLPDLQTVVVADNEVTNLVPLLTLPNLFSIDITDNNLNLTAGTSNAAVVASLQAKGVIITNLYQSLQPVILPGSPQLLPGGRLSLRFSSVLGRNYSVLASTNLTQWTNLGTFQGLLGSSSFTDSNTAPYSRRYYRIQSGP
jgi:hypothetical protein